MSVETGAQADQIENLHKIGPDRLIADHKAMRSAARDTGQRVVLLYDAARRHAIFRLITGNCAEACYTLADGSVAALAAFIDRRFKAARV